jgi:hypothetical protein
VHHAGPGQADCFSVEINMALIDSMYLKEYCAAFGVKPVAAPRERCDDYKITLQLPLIFTSNTLFAQFI